MRFKTISLTKSASLLVVSALALTGPILAQKGNSEPIEEQIVDIVPVAQDKAYRGVMRLNIDARDIDRAIFRVEQDIPVPRSGRFTLLYPEWLPGNHAPRGQIEKLVGLTFTGNGETLKWTRDSLDVYALHIEVPRGVKTIKAKFQFTSATDRRQGRVVVTPNMMNLRWHAMSLYPAGYYTRNIDVSATVTWPEGWQDASAMRARSKQGDTVTYETVDYDTLVDSPVFAGRYFKRWQLSDKVALNVVADAAEDLEASEEQIEYHRRLVREARALFGVEHYDRYDFLLALTEEMGGIGLEHHRSSENGVNRGYFTEWKSGAGRRGLLPHEVVHSWNGKYRRSEGIWAPDFRTESRDDMLWVYEGQTQFWGYILSARSGLFSKQQTLDALANVAASLDQRVGRTWRPLADTTHDPIIAARRPKPWTSWQRSEDYYNEGMLIWLEADGIIRRESGNSKSLEDFAKLFFGGREGDWGVVTYDYDDVVTNLQKIQPYDWDGFLQERVYSTTKEAPKNGLEMGGYRLVYSDKPTDFIKNREKGNGGADLTYSIGMFVSRSGSINAVIWDSPAFKAGLTNGHEIMAVNGKNFSTGTLKEAITEAAIAGSEPLTLLIKKGDRFKTVSIDYSGGLRYPRLEKTGEGEGSLDLLLAPKTLTTQ
jgi:predicted metalloprotease with PDZ domain